MKPEVAIAIVSAAGFAKIAAQVADAMRKHGLQNRLSAPR
jgi:hypothetical protein